MPSVRLEAFTGSRTISSKRLFWEIFLASENIGATSIKPTAKISPAKIPSTTARRISFTKSAITTSAAAPKPRIAPSIKRVTKFVRKYVPLPRLFIVLKQIEIASAAPISGLVSIM